MQFSGGNFVIENCNCLREWGEMCHHHSTYHCKVIDETLNMLAKWSMLQICKNSMKKLLLAIAANILSIKH